MKLVIKGQLPDSSRNIMRHLGYHLFQDAYMRRLGRGHYPRFHVYIKEAGEETKIDLHLDMKKQSLGSKRHGAGNDELVTQERERIKQYILSLT